MFGRSPLGPLTLGALLVLMLVFVPLFVLAGLFVYSATIHLCLKAVGAVDHRRFLELHGDARKERAQRPQHQRHHQCRIDRHEAPEIVSETKIEEGAAPKTAVERALAGRDRSRAALSLLARYGTIIGFAVMLVLFAALSPLAFPTLSNFTNVLNQASLAMIIAWPPNTPEEQFLAISFGVDLICTDRPDVLIQTLVEF